MFVRRYFTRRRWPSWGSPARVTRRIVGFVGRQLTTIPDRARALASAARRIRAGADRRAVVQKHRRRWQPLLSARRVRRLGLGIVALVAIVLTFFGAISMVRGEPWGVGFAEWTERCEGAKFGCSVVTQFLFPLLAFGLGYWIFLLTRYVRVRRAYAAFARQAPTQLVETAGSIVGEIVGRDDVCNVLQEDLKKGSQRQPHVLIGGLGIGKTAVLVRLTQLLAERGAVPVPVRLRNAGERLDFLALARERFVEVLSHRLRSTAEADRVWHELRRDDRIVVLADGLDEAFADADPFDRDHRVRAAVRDAIEQNFPLVIASRPHHSLRALPAARVHLEPLSEEAALDYIKGSEGELDEPRLHWLVETAQVTETPLYLQIAHELYAEGLLEHRFVDARGADRVPLRLQLMKAWREALVRGELQASADVPLAEHHREAAVAHLEALACMGLRFDTQQIDLARQWSGLGEDNENGSRDEEIKDALEAHVQRRIDELNAAHGQTAAEVLDMPAAASRGMQLRLVDYAASGVRFPHSILQAYLASRVLGVALADDAGEEFLAEALRDPGRELLLALVMYARSDGPDASAEERAAVRELVLRRLRVAAATAPEPKRLAVMATEMEIAMAIAYSDRETGWLQVYEAGDRLVGEWAGVRAQDDETKYSKLNAISRLRDAARLIGDARTSVRSAAASPLTGAVPASDAPPLGLYRRLHDVAMNERLYEIRLVAADAIGDGGDSAWDELRDILATADDADGEWSEDRWSNVLRPSRQQVDAMETERRYALRGWLLPMLVLSVAQDDEPGRHDPRHGSSRAAIRGWVELVGDSGMPLSIEAALAQGFKRAANRRPRHSHDYQSGARAFLQHQATIMIHRARFWYTRLTLLHALALWELARLEFPGHAGHDAASDHNPKTMVERWLRPRSSTRRGDASSLVTDEEPHEFVREAADLVVEALRTREPTRFLWIDESDVVSKIGSRAHHGEAYAERKLWIPASAGWVALDARAQQLVADVQLLLNLAERGDSSVIKGAAPSDRPEAAWARELRLRRANDASLPVCLADRRCVHLKPSQTVGVADLPDPGDDCARGCSVELCPYPPRGEQPYRAELSEAFCRHQAWLVGGLRSRARWQRTGWRELKRFWGQMEERARR